MEPNKLSVSSNIVHKPLSINCLTPTKGVTSLFVLRSLLAFHFR